jgi:hypothetical protein
MLPQKLLLPLSLIAVVLGIGLWKQDIIEAHFDGIPILAASSVQSQNGLIMRDINPLKYGAVQMVVEAPQLPTQSSDQWDRKYTPKDAFRVLAHDSQGKTWPLGWNIHVYGEPRPYEVDETKSDLHNRRLLFVDLPPIYPQQLKWVDIEVKDKWNRKATWRLDHLPRAKDAFDGSPKINDLYAKNGVFVSGSAVLQYWNTIPSRAPQIIFKLSGVALPSKTRRWQIERSEFQTRWLPLDAKVIDGSGKRYTILSVGERPGVKATDITGPNNHFGGVGTDITSYYPELNRFAHISFQLNEYATPNGSDSGGTLISSTPVVLTVPVVDLGSVEVRYPTLMKRN